MNQLKTNLTFFLLFNLAVYSTNKPSKINADPKVNIELLNIVTNGLLLPNNTISFNGVEDLEIEFDVKATYTGSNTKITNQGVLNCYYYEPNKFDNETAQYYINGVQGLYLFQKKDIKLESGNAGYSQTFRQKVRFKRSTIYNNGSSFVFRYRTETLSVDISDKLTYQIIGGTKTGIEAYKPSTANAYLTNLSYSDGSPLINNTIIIPDSEGDEIGTKSINLSFNYNCEYGSQLGLGYYPGIEVQIKDNLSVRKYLTEWITPITINGTATFTDLKIKSSDLSPTSYLRIKFTFQGIDKYIDCAIIKGNYEKPILNNIISDNQFIKYGQVSKPFTLSTSPYVDYTIPCARNVRACNPISDYRYITSFKWQTRTENSNWSDVAGAATQEYSPNKAFTENTYYRRLAFVNADQYSISNIASIIIEDTNFNNNICCDQVLQFKNSQPLPIIANNINSSAYTYQWQSAKNWRGTDFQPWKDIIGATNQNHTHIFPQDAITNDEKTQFRRIIKLNSLPINISNSVIISRYSVLDFTPPTRRYGTTGPVRQSVITNNPVEESNDINNLSIYPNPIINNLSIEGSVNINLINLYDSFGQKINIDKHQKSDNLIEVNISTLQSGIYILKVDNTTFSKTLIKN